MPYADHLRVTMSGVINDRTAAPAVQERFAIRLNMSAPGSATGLPANWDQESANDVAADCSAFWGRITSAIASNCVLTEVKWAWLGMGTNSKGQEALLYKADPFIVPVSVAGAAGNMPYPPQVALAVSLETGRRGATGRGRFFLPCPGQGLGADLGVVPAAVDELETSVVQLINDLNNWPGVEAARPKVTVASSKGYNSDVTGVRVGHAFDTIRSRRRDLLERYGATVAIA